MDLLEHKHSESLQRHPWEQARFEVVMNILKTSGAISSAKTIADIGCGDTYVLKSLSCRFPKKQYYGIDNAFTPEIINSLKKGISEDNIQLYNEVSSNNGNIDLVLLMDVVEHVEDDYSFLKQLNNSNLVNSSANYLITVPAYNSLFTAHDKYLKHYRRYNNKELRKLVEKAGFKVQVSGYFFISLLFVRILQKFKEKLFSIQTQKGLNHRSYSTSMIKIIKLVLLLDFGISRIFTWFLIKLPGLSTYVVCKKSV